MVRFRGVIANLRQSKRKVKLLLDVEAQARLNSKHKSSLGKKGRSGDSKNSLQEKQAAHY